MDKTANRRLSRIAMTFVCLSIIFAVTFTFSGKASAYPNGWTADATVPNVTNANQVEIAAKGDLVHLVYQSFNPNRIWYVRSSDKGATWGAPVRIDLVDNNQGDSSPTVATGQGDTVYVAYSSNERDNTPYRPEVLLRRSQDGGLTWDSGYWNCIEDVSINGNQAPSFSRKTMDNPALVYMRFIEGTLQRSECYMRIIRDGVMETADTRVSSVASDTDPTYNPGEVDKEYSSSYPRIAGDGKGNWCIIFQDQMWTSGCSYKQAIRINARYGGVNKFYVSPIEHVHRNEAASLRFPDITYDGERGDGLPGGLYTICWTWDPGGSGVRDWLIKGTQIVGNPSPGQGSSGAYLYYGHSDDPPASKSIGRDFGWMATRDNDKRNVSGCGGNVSRLMADCYPLSDDFDSTNGRAIATNIDGEENRYLAVATTDRQIKVKRLDSITPTGTIHILGNEFQGKVFVKPTFRFEFQGVADDWNHTGTDPFGDQYTDGVTSIRVLSSGSPSGAFTDFLMLDDAPWQAAVSGVPDGSLWLRGWISDTALNMHGTESEEIVVDSVSPTCSISLDPRPQGEWQDENILVTLAGSDNAGPLSKIEYRLNEGQWHGYLSPFELTDGRWKLEARSFDLAGNESSIQSENFKIDTTEPTCMITRPEGETIDVGVGENAFRINASCQDGNGYGLLTWSAIYVDGEKVSETEADFAMSYDWNISNIADSSWHTIEVRCRDAAGKEASALRTAKLVKAPDVAPPPVDPVDPVGPDDPPVYPDNPTENGTMRNWYFAEGNTLKGFDEYICIFNPGEKTANVSLTYMLGTGQTIADKLAVEPRCRTTIAVNNVVPANQDVSTWLASDVPVVAERPMYFTRNGINDGSVSAGVQVPSNEFFFAEGTTRKGFETYLTIQNPTSSTATVTMSYMLSNGQNIAQQIQVPPTTRTTLPVADFVGAEKDFSIKVESDKRIVAERPMYFNYQNKWNGGHVVAGTPNTSKEWYFAEGCTYDWADEYICLLNPTDSTANVKLRYLTSEGQVIEKTRRIRPRSRDTVVVQNDVGLNKDVSTGVTSDVGIVAERPMYFAYQNKWTGGHDVLGANAAATTWFFAEGTTRDNFNEWLCLQNPGSADAVATITYYTSTGQAINKPWTVPANSRITVNVNQDAGANRDISAEVFSDNPIVVERPMYFNNNGLDGGHDVVGFVPSQ